MNPFPIDFLSPKYVLCIVLIDTATTNYVKEELLLLFLE
jgi:hypothetical protein